MVLRKVSYTITPLLTKFELLKDSARFSCASKVMSHLGYGCAAGCEAWALPRRKPLLKDLGYALVRPLAQYSERAKPEPGAEPEEHRLLSRGGARASHPAAKP